MSAVFVWVEKEAGDDVIEQLLAELYRPSSVCIDGVALYRPSCSVSADIVTPMIWIDFAI